MELITEDLLRALLFLRACNAESVWPTAPQLDLFIQTKQPKSGRSASTLNLFASRNLSLSIFGSTWVPGDKVSQYLLDVQWAAASPHGNIRLTPLGQSFLRGMEISESVPSDEVTVMTASPENPISLSQILHVIQDKHGEMFVDPYLDYDAFQLLIANGVSRILTTSAYLTSAIKMLIAELDASDKTEVRVTNKGKLHDRVIIHQDGGVSLVGTSMRRTNNPYTSLVNLPSSLSGPIRAAMEQLWVDSQPLEEITFKKK